MPRYLSRPLVVVLAVAAVIFFANLGGARLFDDDEGKNSTCGREMLARGDWLVPTFNQDLRTDKPVLIYWFMLVSYHTWGVSEFAARFWSAAWGVGTVALTYALGRRLFGPGVGFWAGLMLATAVMFDVAARAATPDSTLIFFATLSLWLFVRYVPGAIPSAAPAAMSPPLAAPGGATPALDDTRWFHVIPMYAAMGLAVLAKGPVGVALPSLALVLYVALLRAEIAVYPRPASGWRERLLRGGRALRAAFGPRPLTRAIWLLRPDIAFLTVGLVALPWYIAVGIETDGAWLAGFLGKHNVHRFLEPMEGHRGPIVYYVLALLIGFFPWSIFLSLSVWELGREVRRGNRWHAPYLFLACWAGFYIGFFSLARTKLPSYILPAYPAVAIITAAFVMSWMRDPARVPRLLLRLALVSVPLVGVGILIALPIVAHFILPGQGWLGLIGLLLIVGGGYACREAFAGRVPRAAAALGVTAVLFAIVVFDFAAPWVGNFQNSWPTVAAMRRHAGDAAQLATLDYFVPSLPYYAAGRVEKLDSIESAVRFLREHPQGFLVTRDKHAAQLAAHLPRDVAELQRQRRFLRSGEIVLFGRPAATASQPTPHTPR
ncbi:MAG: glycosyltransferase family 39 protein [Planctomycetaceae bacterium]|nr:glycosyltransferase family 39 protein [Planctomycetaceae bacterium]